MVTSASKLHLGFYYHIPAIAEDGVLFFHGPLGVFIDGLAELCDEITCFLHSPESGETPILDYRIKSPNVQLVDLGTRGSVLYRNLNHQRFTTILKNHLSDIDILLIRGPSPLLPMMASSVGNMPVALMLVGDYLQSAGIDYAQPGWRLSVIKLWARWYQQRQLEVARRSLVFVNTQVLYHQLEHQIPNLIETRTTTLHTGDFYEREDTCQRTPIRLLYTGRIAHQKGLFVMLDAIEGLIKANYDVTLDLAGWASPGDHTIKRLYASLESKGLQERIIYHGYKPLGPDLFALYRQADLYINSSYAEGFPRAIWEAMAHSLPVIATRVGSIPDFISGAAELVEPGSADALASAVKRLLENPNLRRGYIQRGMKLARENTIETRSTEMVVELLKWKQEIETRTRKDF